MHELEKHLHGASDLTALIVGDIMIDSYVWGRVDRMSPEAPVPVIFVEKKERRLGGAANVARNMHSLGAKTYLAGVLGEDEMGSVATSLLREEGIDDGCIVQSNERKTTVKERIYHDEEPVLRVDTEDEHEVSQEESDELLRRIKKIIKKVDILILQDYDKGVLHESSITKLIELAREHNITIAVDPKFRNIRNYRGVDLFKPNLKEVSEGFLLSIDPEDHESLSEAVDTVKDSIEAKNVLLTLSENGVFVDMFDTQHHVPTNTTEVIDVSGAGDSVLCIAAILLHSQADPLHIGHCCNLAGGIACSETGVAVLNKDSLRKAIREHFKD